jgi:hypothetical protein
LPGKSQKLALPIDTLMRAAMGFVVLNPPAGASLGIAALSGTHYAGRSL